MSVEERLFALAQQCRQQNGDAFLVNTSQFAPRLNSQAPDLHAEIRALAAAFEMGAAARIAAAPDQAGAVSAIASEIAVRERLSMAAIAPALAVARRLGPLNAAPAAPSAGGWAGDSVAVGAAAPAHAPPAPPPAYQQPAYAAPQAPYTQAPYPHAPAQAGATQADKFKAMTKNPWVMGAAALVLGFLVYQNFMAPSEEIQTMPIGQGADPQQPPGAPGAPGPGGVGNQPGPGGVPGGQTPITSQPGGAAPGQMPVLGQPGAGPTLQVQQHQSGGPAVGFALTTPRGAAPGIVMLPAGGWQAGPVGLGLASPGDTSGQFASAGQGQFQLVQSNGHPVRLAQIQMSQDALGVGNVCVMFRGQQGQQDVQLSGADFCIMDGPCSRPLGCGRLQ